MHELPIVGKTLSRLTCTALLWGAALAAQAAAVPSAAELVARAKAGPSLVLTRAQADDLRARIKADRATAAWWQGIRAKAAEYLKDEVKIPDRGAQWVHYYNCKACGVSLKADSPTAHRCPKCGKVYSGWPWDDVYVNRYHERLKETVYTCGLVYAVDGDRACAERVKAVMLGYAAQYPKYPLINNRGPWTAGQSVLKYSRAHSQPLDEAVWLCRLLPGYDWAKDAFTAEEKALLERNFFRLAVDIFKNDNAGIHNHECWHLSAYGLIGLLVGDEGLVDAAVNSKTGLIRQLAQGVDEDGCWFEGSWGYHFYAMMALRPIVTALWNLGYAPPARFKAMFDAPFVQVAPNWELPALNDSGPVRFSPKTLEGVYGDFYDLAWLWWRDPRYAWWLGENPDRKGQGYAKFLYGTRSVSGPAAGDRFASANAKGSGFAILRSDSAAGAGGVMPDNYVGLDYGPVGGGHGHGDKLNLVLYHGRDRLAEDPGCIGYSNQRQWCWYRSSLAHNELVMDGLNQKRTAAKCLWYEPCGNGGVMLFDACDAYPGAKVRRALALDGDVLLDLYVAEAEREHRWEWAFHARGRFETALALSPLALPPPDLNTKFSWGSEQRAPADLAWTWTERAKEGRFDGTWSGRWTDGEGRVLVTVSQEVIGLGDVRPIPGTFRTAAGTAQPASHYVELAVPRVTARRVAFLTAYRLGGGPALRLKDRTVSPDGAVAFSVASGARTCTLRIQAPGSSRPVDFLR